MKRQRTSSLHKYSLCLDNSHDDGGKKGKEKLFRLSQISRWISREEFPFNSNKLVFND